MCGCYGNDIFNFNYVIVVLIGKTCPNSIMIFNSSIFYMLFHFIADCEQAFHNVLRF